MRPYIVRQGDYVARIASALGLDPDAIWQHPRNEALRRARGDPYVLNPGDVLFVPEAARTTSSVRPGVANRYVGRRAQVPVTVLLRAGDGSPMANERYTANTGAAVVHGTTDSEGRASLSVPVTTSEVTLSLDARAVELSLLVGHLDPIDEPSGVRQRLESLGYLSEDAAEAGRHDDPLAAALRTFQTEYGLEVTGVADEATRSKLADAHAGEASPEE